jgi:general secretion pathway protein G
MTNRRAPARRRSRRQAGVTLIEMLVVVTIIALFAAVVAPKLFTNVDKSRAVSAKVQIDNFMNAAGQFKLESGNFPTTEQGLAALRPYLQKDIPNDPWGHAYTYKFPGEHGDMPDIVSLGADGQPGGEGYNADIVSWKN